MVYHFNGWVLNCFIIIYFVLVSLLKFKYKKSYTFLLFFSIMYVYMCNVIKLTQFPIYVDDLQREAFGGQNVWREMNLIPFKYTFTKENVFNILMTVPFGFGLPFIIKSSFMKTLIVGAITGAILELGQLLSALYAGYTFRYVDINDVIYNLTGVLIGYLVFKIFKKIFNASVKKFNIKSNSIINHILNT